MKLIKVLAAIALALSLSSPAVGQSNPYNDPLLDGVIRDRQNQQRWQEGQSTYRRTAGQAKQQQAEQEVSGFLVLGVGGFAFYWFKNKRKIT